MILFQYYDCYAGCILSVNIQFKPFLWILEFHAPRKSLAHIVTSASKQWTHIQLVLLTLEFHNALCTTLDVNYTFLLVLIFLINIMLLEQHFLFCNPTHVFFLACKLEKTPIPSFQIKYQFQYQCLQFCLCYTCTMHVYRLLYIALHQCNNLIELTIVPSTRTESR